MKNDVSIAGVWNYILSGYLPQKKKKKNPLAREETLKQCVAVEHDIPHSKNSQYPDCAVMQTCALLMHR